MRIFPTSGSEVVMGRAAARAVAIAGLLAAAMFLGGCYASLDGYNNNVIKGPAMVETMKRRACNNPDAPCADWDNPSYHRANGNPVFCEGKPKCQTHWEVDRTSLRIVRWRVEARSGDFWARNHCDFVPAPGYAYSPWYSRNGSEGHAEEETSKSCFR